VKRLLNRIARFFGYEIRKIEPPIPPAVVRLLDSAEAGSKFDVDVGMSRLEPVPDGKLDIGPLEDSGRAVQNWIVEGWRFIPHSYAIVNQWQLLALSRRRNLALKVTDVPFFRLRWQMQEGLFEQHSEQVLRSFETARPEESADITLRVFFPFDFSPSRSPLTAVFGTSESQVIQRPQLADFRAYDQLKHTPPPMNVRAITPSRWSAEGFYKAGFKTEQVLVIPHGVDVGLFRPMPSLRGYIRSKVPVEDENFVFLSIGAMTGNKGMTLLLRAFTEVCRKFPHARLLLKGMDPLYNSKNFLLKSIQKIPTGDQQFVLDKITYIGNSFSHKKMAMLYQAADCYVSPYRAEGFNMPVLEAAASGLPIICTAGGATDDFVTDMFARKIEAKKHIIRVEDQDLSQLEPSVEHLITLMASAIEDNSWRSQAAEAGPLHVGANYTWDRVVDMLVRKLSN